MRKTAITLVFAGLSLTACGGSGPPAGTTQAQAACSTPDAQLAAQDAAAAAKLNSRYATLSVDEAARAAAAGQQTGELADGTGDDSGLGALTGATTLGSGGGIKVIEDCTSLGLHIPH